MRNFQKGVGPVRFNKGLVCARGPGAFQQGSGVCVGPLSLKKDPVCGPAVHSLLLSIQTNAHHANIF